MLPTVILDRFVERCPAVVMVRATLENLLRPERLDQIFEDARQRQYSKQLLFSQVVAVMAAVVTRTHTSVHSAYLAMKDRLGVSPAALYEKLNHTEPELASGMVRQIAADAAKIIDVMPSAKKVILPGLEVFYLDGNHLAATEHRLAELRTTREGPLPGQSLALLDAQRELIVDLVPCEDGYTQERALLPELLQRLRKGMVLVADRNFCTTKFLFGLADLGAYFVIRQHGSTLSWTLLRKRRRVGRIASGTVYEQRMELRSGEAVLVIRRVTLCLDHPTENGDTEIHVLTNLSAEQATGLQVAEAYGTRWTVEGAFQTLTDVLRCEIKTLGYPRAALLGFATAVLAYNTYAVVKAALRAVHGTTVIQEKLSDYHLLGDVAVTYVGMDIAVPDECWAPYRTMTASRFAQKLKELAHHVKLSRYPKQKRGPKKPQPRKKSGARNHHISIARVLAERKKKSP